MLVALKSMRSIEAVKFVSTSTCDNVQTSGQDSNEGTCSECVRNMNTEQRRRCEEQAGVLRDVDICVVVLFMAEESSTL